MTQKVIPECFNYVVMYGSDGAGLDCGTKKFLSYDQYSNPDEFEMKDLSPTSNPQVRESRSLLLQIAFSDLCSHDRVRLQRMRLSQSVNPQYLH